MHISRLRRMSLYAIPVEEHTMAWCVNHRATEWMDFYLVRRWKTMKRRQRRQIIHVLSPRIGDITGETHACLERRASTATTPEAFDGIA